MIAIQESKFLIVGEHLKSKSITRFNFLVIISILRSVQAILPPPNTSVITEDQLRNAAIQATRIEEVSYMAAGSKVKYES